MTNLFSSTARSLIGLAGAALLSLGLLTATVAPALTQAPATATQSA